MKQPDTELGRKDAGASPRRLTTILVADICGYSRMSERDEAEAIRIADLLYKMFETTTQNHGGRVFSRIADGFLAEFPSARSGMQAALDYAKEVKARNNLAPNAIDADIRAGIHVGDVTDRPDGNILGHGVNVAARLQEMAEPGTILASSNIMNLTRKDIPFKINKRAGLSLKNISAPITAFQIDPEKSGGGFDIQIPKIFKSKAFLYTALAGVVMYGAMEFQGQRAEAAWEERVRVIIEKIEDESSGKNSVSEPYIRNVLENLHRSDIPSHQASLVLLEEGHISLAIERLEESLDAIDFGSEDYVDTLHIIAALSYHNRPQKARAIYETLLEIDETDKNALIWLIRTYNLFANSDKAVELYQKLVASKNLDEYDSIRLNLDMAFSVILTGDFISAEKMLLPLEPGLIALGDERLYIRWLTDLGFIYERTGKLKEAEVRVSTAISKLENIGADEFLPKAYNVMGLINEKYAEQDPTKQVFYLSRALASYKKQYETGILISKTREIAEPLHFMARVKFKLGDVDEAYEDYAKSYRIAREDGYTGSEFKSLLGFAQIEKYRGNDRAACQAVDKAAALFEKKMGPNLGPTSRELIKYTECDFTPKNLPYPQ